MNMRNAVILSLAGRIGKGLDLGIEYIEDESGKKYSIGTFQFERIL